MDHQQLVNLCNNKGKNRYEEKLSEVFTNSFNYGTPSTLKTKINYQYVDVDSIYKAVADKNFGYQARLLELGHRDITNSIISILPKEIINLINHNLKYFRLNFHDFDQKYIIDLSLELSPAPASEAPASPPPAKKKRKIYKPWTW